MKEAFLRVASPTSKLIAGTDMPTCLERAIHSIMSGGTAGSESGLVCLQLGAGGRGGAGLGAGGAMLGEGAMLGP